MAFTGFGTGTPRSSRPQRPGSFGVGDWYNQPELMWAGPNSVFAGSPREQRDAAGNLIPRTRQSVQLPAWASSFGSPREFYTHLSGLDPALRSTFIAQQRADYNASQQNERSRQAALDAVGRQREDFQGYYDDWRNDPRMEGVLDELERRSGPGYEAISDRQRAGYDLDIAQNAARNQSAMEASAAGRGTGGGGADIASQATARGVADAAGVRVQAEVDAANERARAMNLEHLDRALRANRGIDLAYENALGELTRMETGILTGYQYNPTDFTGWAMLSDAMRRADDESAFRDDALEMLEEETKFQLDDLINLGLGTIGTGLWDIVF